MDRYQGPRYEFSNVEDRSQFLRVARAKVFDPQPSRFVSQRLARPDYVTVHFNYDVVLGLRGILGIPKEVYCRVDGEVKSCRRGGKTGFEAV